MAQLFAHVMPRWKMSILSDQLTIVGNLPDQAVLSKTQACALMCVSVDTLDRLHRLGEGPQRIQLSPRRVGYSVGSLRSWMVERSSK
jgi:predicted DNA-binding transcriptional regulator AlpA